MYISFVIVFLVFLSKKTINALIADSAFHKIHYTVNLFLPQQDKAPIPWPSIDKEDSSIMLTSYIYFTPTNLSLHLAND